jgi:hypothetical protein
MFGNAVVADNQLTFVVLRMLSLLIPAINAGNPRTFFGQLIPVGVISTKKWRILGISGL